MQEKIAALSQAADAAPVPEIPQSGRWKWLGGLGTAGVFLWKFKFLLVSLATKGKLLLLGLTKASTFFSMLLAFGVYWTAWGMWFALGVVLSIYVHEMGHVFALRRFGIAATAPMFIPGLGALIRLRGQRLSPREDARVGLAGPMWGLAAALAALAGSALVAARCGRPSRTSARGSTCSTCCPSGSWTATAVSPRWQGIRRLAVAAAFVAGWMIAGDGLFFLLILVAGGARFIRCTGSQRPRRADGVHLPDSGARHRVSAGGLGRRRPVISVSRNASTRARPSLFHDAQAGGRRIPAASGPGESEDTLLRQDSV